MTNAVGLSDVKASFYLGHSPIFSYATQRGGFAEIPPGLARWVQRFVHPHAAMPKHRTPEKTGDCNPADIIALRSRC